MTIYVFDLDNTLCLTNENNYNESIPLKDRIEKVNKLYDEGHTIIIDSARGGISGKNHFYYTLEQLKSWGLKFHTLRTGIKFNPDILVDDRAINDKDFFDDDNYLKKESGGKTKVILVNRVYKEATDERSDKLKDEIDFIESIPEEFKSHFPRILSSGSSANKTFYEMEHYSLPTLRRLILSGSISKEEVLKVVERVLKFSLDMYNYEKINFLTNAEYFKYMHSDRYYRRIRELTRKSDFFKRLVREENIHINGKEYKNLTKVIPEILKYEIEFYPAFIGRWSHSDLHFSNTLVDLENDNFILIDPRGYPYCDYYYDFGKILHSVNGKYELISDGQFDLGVVRPTEFIFNFNNSAPKTFLTVIKEPIEQLLYDYSMESKETTHYKSYFNEVMHFACLIPFMLDFDGKEKRALAAYCRATQLANEFMENL